MLKNYKTSKKMQVTEEPIDKDGSSRKIVVTEFPGGTREVTEMISVWYPKMDQQQQEDAARETFKYA